MQFQQSLHTHWAQNGRISTTQFHNLKYLEGNCMRNVSPGDERQPQGLRAHIHTFTMRAFSDSSAKRFAQHGASSGSSAKKLAQHTPTNTRPDTKLALHTPSHRMRGTKLAQQLLSHRMCGTKLAQHETHRATAVQNSPCAPLHTACAVQNSPCSPKMAQFCAFCPRMANFLPLSPPTSHAGRTFSRSHPHQAEQENSSCELSRR